MSSKERLEQLLKLEKLNKSQFCKSIEYDSKNLSNYLNGSTNNPNGKLIEGILKKYPHWNIRYWFLGEGLPRQGKNDLKKVEEDFNTYQKDRPIIKELTEQLSFMRKEIERKDIVIRSLKNVSSGF